MQQENRVVMAGRGELIGWVTFSSYRLSMHTFVPMSELMHDLIPLINKIKRHSPTNSNFLPYKSATHTLINYNCYI